MCDKKVIPVCNDIKVTLPLFSCFILMWSTVPKEQKDYAIEELLSIIEKDSDISPDLLNKFIQSVNYRINKENKKSSDNQNGYGIKKEIELTI